MDDYEPQPYNELAEQVGLHQATQQNSLVASQTKQLQYQMEEAEQTLAEAQLDCEKTLNKIYHLLKQDTLTPTEEGGLDWKEISDSKKRVLTDEGVDKIMQIMESYINKETLLSNFDDKQINRRMLDFCLALSALLFLKYEIFFRTPTLEECKTILINRINQKVRNRVISLEILEKKCDEKQIRREVLNELEGKLQYEIEKIKQERIKLNLREFEIIFRQLESLVEATHNRAWKGEERGSLRRHFNISEVIGGKSQQQEKKKWGLF